MFVKLAYFDVFIWTQYFKICGQISVWFATAGLRYQAV